MTSKIQFDQTSYVPKGSYVYVVPAFEDSGKKYFSGFLISKSNTHLKLVCSNMIINHSIDECYYDYFYKVCESKKSKMIRRISLQLSNKPDVKIDSQYLDTESVLDEAEKIFQKFNKK